MIRPLLSVAATAALSLPSLRAQEDAAPTRLSPAAVELKTFRTTHVDCSQLFDLLTRLHGRTLTFQDGRETPNILQGNDSVIVYEEKGRMQAIAAAIAELDRADKERPEDLQVIVYEPHCPADQLLAIAQPILSRAIRQPGGAATGSLAMSEGRIVITEFGAAAAELRERLRALDDALGTSQRSLQTLEYSPRVLPAAELTSAAQQLCSPGGSCTLVGEHGLLVVRDTESNLVSIRKVLERIDRPVPQLMVSAFVLTGADDGGNAQPELADALRQLLPYPAYRVESSSLVRVAARAGSPFQVELSGPNDVLNRRRSYRLNGNISAYDETDVALSFTDLCASSDDDNKVLFSTSTTVYANEYAVLGVVGHGSVFIVLRIQPVAAARTRKSN